MIVWGGRVSTSSASNTGGRYDPGSDTWAMTSMGSGVPTPRDSHVAVWTGSEMIVWGGGLNTSSLVITGSRYDPVADTWLPVSTGAGCPSARTFAAGVWTGTEMIVWGGIAVGPIPGFPVSVGDGARYSPSTDTWMTTMSAGAPSPRDAHTAVWTGTEMIVWGGESPAPLGTGGRYDPAQNSWTAVSTNGAAAARRGHSAVWTGAEMIVWGG
jgi:N-acetylneuraminic acid mutarotase